MDYMDGPFNYRAQVCDLNARLVCYSNPDCIGNWDDTSSMFMLFTCGTQVL